MKKQYYYIVIPIIAIFLILIGVKCFFSYRATDTKEIDHLKDGYAYDLGVFYNTKYNETNVRMGPGYDYPVKFKITSAKYPLKEIVKYGDWIKIIDFEDEEGWVYKNLVSSPKMPFIIVLNNSFMYSSPKSTSKKIAKIGRYNVAVVQKIDNNFIKIKIHGISGWIDRHNIWGKI